ncbi:MAG: hypothetical protein ACM3KE_18840 [Hyphomicrobiales bacterium]
MKERKSEYWAGLNRDLKSEWIERSGRDRRSDRDKRLSESSLEFYSRRTERRKVDERRLSAERREGWMRAGKWQSVCVFDD